MTAEELVTGIRQNDAAALINFYEELGHWGGFFYRRGRDEAQDLWHDTWLAAVGAIQAGRLLQPAALWGYVKSIAFSIRNPGKRPFLPLKEAVTTTVSQDLSVSVDAEKALKASGQEELLRRVYWEGDTPEELAAEHGVRYNLICLHKSRALRKAQRALQRKRRK